jgi:UPF0716 protein FxsA
MFGHAGTVMGIMKRILLGFLLFGFVELFLLIEAGRTFGTWLPIASVLLSMAAGGLLIRHSGLKTLRGLAKTLKTGHPPRGSPAMGILGVIAGILLILPGFLSDVMALLIYIPAARRIVASALGLKAPAFIFTGQPSQARPRGPIIEAEAVEIHGAIRSPEPSGQSSPWRR